MTVLQVCPLLPSLEEALRGQFTVVDTPSPEVVAAVTSSRHGVTRDQMDAMPALGAIVHFGVGYETTDVDHARVRGIAVSNTPDVLTDCVADLAVGAMIDVLRRLSAADRFVRRGDWLTGSYPLATRVSGRRVGILGLGRIGRAIAHRLTAFDARVSYHSRHRVPDTPYRYVDSPEALAAAVDVLVVATSGGAATEGLVSARVLEALGPAGYLVNIARGSVVDEPALVAALTGGTIAGAALDVFADEPRVPSVLLAMDNVVLLPHIASATTETREAMGELAFANLRQFMTDGTLLTPVP
ncbi:2-hydroxyacid dehydrogenase [Actinophytocola oryzae]|uniref:Lactate dehydrogenase-like 2-hydroxyacid dehydrogenase n=1 Tax=Actinophytocola oryzae TaxID=502181 RepID=A0A4V3FRH6_9PSEU|nr:2-hydroxyacid dehydrogenase [Actinophytocola oryzae]TDV43591.1 lactate dehydrogenase-like 2-hydroxyacid dehydrogenase [Actinophytocola oryzae]